MTTIRQPQTLTPSEIEARFAVDRTKLLDELALMEQLGALLLGMPDVEARARVAEYLHQQYGPKLKGRVS